MAQYRIDVAWLTAWDHGKERNVSVVVASSARTWERQVCDWQMRGRGKRSWANDIITTGRIRRIELVVTNDGVYVFNFS